MKKHFTMYCLEAACMVGAFVLWRLTDGPRFALMAAGCCLLLGTEGVA